MSFTPQEKIQADRDYVFGLFLSSFAEAYNSGQFDNEKSAQFEHAGDNLLRTMIADGDMDGLKDITSRQPTLKEMDTLLSNRVITPLKSSLHESAVTEVHKLITSHIGILSNEMIDNAKLARETLGLPNTKHTDNIGYLSVAGQTSPKDGHQK